MRWSDLNGRDDLGPLSRLLSLALLLLPTGLLCLLASRYEAVTLVAGAGVQALFAVIFLRVHPIWRPPVSSSNTRVPKPVTHLPASFTIRISCAR